MYSSKDSVLISGCTDINNTSWYIKATSQCHMRLYRKSLVEPSEWFSVTQNVLQVALPWGCI